MIIFCFIVICLYVMSVLFVIYVHICVCLDMNEYALTHLLVLNSVYILKMSLVCAHLCFECNIFTHSCKFKLNISKYI